MVGSTRYHLCPCERGGFEKITRTNKEKIGERTKWERRMKVLVRNSIKYNNIHCYEMTIHTNWLDYTLYKSNVFLPSLFIFYSNRTIDKFHRVIDLWFSRKRGTHFLCFAFGLCVEFNQQIQAARSNSNNFCSVICWVLNKEKSTCINRFLYHARHNHTQLDPTEMQPTSNAHNTCATFTCNSFFFYFFFLV